MASGKLSLGMVDCISNYGDPKMFGISNIKTSYANIGAARSIESVRALIEEDASMIVSKDINGGELTPPEMQSEENSFGKTGFLRIKPANDVIFLKTNPADYNGFVGAFHGETYWIEPYLVGGGNSNFKILHKNDDGTLSAFPAEVVAVPVGVPTFEGKNQAFKLNLLWDNIEDWNNVVLIPLVDPLSDYEDLMPIGWDNEAAGAYAATEQDFRFWERNDVSALMTQTPTARIIDQNVAAPVVTFGAPVLGVSTITATKESSPVTMVAGEFITFVPESKTGSVVDYTSNEITIKGV